MNTFSITDTSNFMTDDPNFAVVSLRQGSDPTKKCTVTLEMIFQQDLYKIEHNKNNKDDYWASQNDSTRDSLSD